MAYHPLAHYLELGRCEENRNYAIAERRTMVVRWAGYDHHPDFASNHWAWLIRTADGKYRLRLAKKGGESYHHVYTFEKDAIEDMAAWMESGL